MMGRAAATATFVRASAGADIALIEGMMGLFDGASPTSEVGSTAELAKWLNAPVLLVVDASGVARSIAALVGGFAAFDRDLAVAGVICNHVGGRGHVALLRQAQHTPPILGGLSRQSRLAFPERHLGLRSADSAAVPDEVIDGWGAQMAEEIDLDAVLALARGAPPLPAIETAPAPTSVSARCRIGIALDDAFHFYYEDNLRRLEALGAELVHFSPLGDARLPDVDGLYIGGGYPEVHAAALAGNRSMRDDIARFAAAGRPVYAECGGLMYLASAVRGLDGHAHAMVGVLPGTAVMSDRLEAIGYVEVETQGPSLLGPAGLRFRGHQFRYSRLEGAETAAGAYTLRRPGSGVTANEGYRAGAVLGSYVHAHWASNPQVAEGFVAGCIAARSAV
jgi:cobyrinic acid a,c-diamide synthase